MTTEQKQALIAQLHALIDADEAKAEYYLFCLFRILDAPRRD